MVAHWTFLTSHAPGQSTDRHSPGEG